jgi:hypothetical protein
MLSRQLTWQVDSYLPQARASPLSQLCFQVRQPGFFHGWLSNSPPPSPRPGRCRWPLSTQNFWEMEQLTLPPSWQEDLAG